MSLKKMKVWAAASKWRKHQLLANSPFIRPFLPDTAELTKETLAEFLKKYPSVYLKPVYGSGGHGIMRITSLSQGYELKSIRSVRKFKKTFPLFQQIKHIVGNKAYIIQQGIDLLDLDGDPIDFRVLILKPADRWEVMGIMGKLGKRNKIVTNYCQGAQAITLEEAIERSSLENKDIDKIEKLLSIIGLEVANLVSSRYKYVREIGLDVAIDKDEQIWIIEANTRPNFRLFKHHLDPTLYSKIYRYIRRIRLKQVN